MERPRILVVGSMNMDLFMEGANTIRNSESPFYAEIMGMPQAEKAPTRLLRQLCRGRM